jgi:hypothetical protein
MPARMIPSLMVGCCIIRHIHRSHDVVDVCCVVACAAPENAPADLSFDLLLHFAFR